MCMRRVSTEPPFFWSTPTLVSCDSVTRILGFIPSPETGILHVGPIPLHAYGLCLAIGVLVAATVAERRWEAKGGRPGGVGGIGGGGGGAGGVGARGVHLVTRYDLKTGGGAGTGEIWRGGLV